MVGITEAVDAAVGTSVTGEENCSVEAVGLNVEAGVVSNCAVRVVSVSAIVAAFVVAVMLV